MNAPPAVVERSRDVRVRAKLTGSGPPRVTLPHAAAEPAARPLEPAAASVGFVGDTVAPERLARDVDRILAKQADKSRGFVIPPYDPARSVDENLATFTRVFSELQALGADRVRFQVHQLGQNHLRPDGTLDRESLQRWEDTQLEFLKQAIPAARDKGLTFVLDVHEYGGMVKDAEGNPIAERIFTHPEIQEAYLGFWAKIADTFKDTDRSNLVYEPKNEPIPPKLEPDNPARAARDTAQWDALEEQVVSLITAAEAGSSHKTPIVVAGPLNNPGGLRRVADKLVAYERAHGGRQPFIVSVHMYHPFGKTHFGTKPEHLEGSRKAFAKKDLATMKKMMFDPVTQFAKTVNDRLGRLQRRGEFPGVDPKDLAVALDVGEFSISRFTKNQYGWFREMYRFLERTPSVVSWTKHAYQEAPIWNHPLDEAAGQLTAAILAKTRSA